MHPTPDTTIRDIVSADFRAAAVFQSYGIDFCCKGARAVGVACAEAGIPVERVLEDVAAACGASQAGAPRYGAWDIPMLTTYIVGNHHTYVREAIPTLLAHTAKVARVHGERHPELKEVARIFADVAEEMESHMFKEEQVLFPYLLALARAGMSADLPPAPFSTIASPIDVMELEHEHAGDAMARIRTLTSGYQPPEDACATYRVCLQELAAFETDLHAHVHLENNILFPKALRLEASLSTLSA